jgi:hypothetical protein
MATIELLLGPRILQFMMNELTFGVKTGVEAMQPMQPKETDCEHEKNV